VKNATSISNHASIYLSLLFCKFPKTGKLPLATKLTFFWNMSLVLPGTWRTNLCSMILKSFRNFFFKLILCSIILKLFPNRFFQPRTRVTLCRVHNMVLDDVHNVAHISATIIVLSSKSIFYLAIPSIKSFLSDLFHSGLTEFPLRKHSNLMFYLTYQSILIDMNVFVYLLIPFINIC
jgi:hypothetical protein